TVLASALALAVTGVVSAKLGGSPTRAATVRNIGGGMVAICITYVIGALLGSHL
ncbi:VIT family protein, partial [Propionibacterium freudenreichii]|nr:VIT family protein [Propionibacterium freudenreichii]